MGILSTIFQKIFPPSHPAVTQDASAAATSSSAGMQQSAPGSSQFDSSSTATAAKPAATGTVMPEVDVENILDSMPSAESLNWRTSIVDLLKLLGVDSSFQSRTALAHELGFTGNTSDSASMNIWLHQQVMSKVAANGGKLPANLS